MSLRKDGAQMHAFIRGLGLSESLGKHGEIRLEWLL